VKAHSLQTNRQTEPTDIDRQTDRQTNREPDNEADTETEGVVRGQRQIDLDIDDLDTFMEYFTGDPNAIQQFLSMMINQDN
jgi:hypothetical protein